MSHISIDKNKCIRCKKCEKDCVSHAISIDTFSIAKTCILCGHCIAICDSNAVSMKLKEIKPIQKQTISPIEFQNLCTHTRSCRNYKQKSVEPEIIEQLIANMAHYPSASNTRKIQVTVITNQNLIKELNDYVAQRLLGMFKMVAKPGIKQIFKLLYGKKEIKKIVNYSDSFKKKIDSGIDNITYKAPVIMIFHSEKQNMGMLQTDADIWATYTNLYASTFGLGSCFIGFIVKGLHGKCDFKQKLSIPENHIVYTALIIGYPQYLYANETSREKPLNTIIN